MTEIDPIRILYVEDDEGAARLFQRKMAASGYEVDLALDGQEGISKWLAGKYDVLATDHDMPGRKGLDLIRELADKGHLPPTIMITGHGNETIAVEAMKLGADDYIMKDSDARYLELAPQRIREALQRRRVLEERREAAERLQWESNVNSALADLYIPLMSPSATISQIAEVVLDKAKALTGSEHGYVGEIDLQSGALVSHTLTNMMGDGCRMAQAGQGAVFPKGPDGRYPKLWGHSLTNLDAFYTNAPAAHPSSGALPDGHIPIRRFLSVPVVIDMDLAGQIALANSEKDYDDRDLEAVKRLAAYFALGIQRKRWEDALRKRDEALEVRNRISGFMLSNRPDEDVYDEVLKAVLTAMKSPLGIFGYVNEEGSMALPSLTRSVWDQCRIPEKDIVVPREQWVGLWGEIFAGKRTVCSSGPFNLPYGHLHVEHFLGIPLLHEGELIGTLQAANKEGGYDQRDIEFLQSIGDFLAPVLRAKLEKRRQEDRALRAADARRSSEERFRRLLQQAPDAVFIHNHGGKILEVNEQACASLGYTRDELLAMTVSDVDPDAASRRDSEIFWPNLPATFEARHRRKDGSVFPVEIRLGTIDHADCNVVLAVARDLTIRNENDEVSRRHTEFLRNILDSNINPFYVINAEDYTVEMANPAAASAGVIAGLSCFSATHGRNEPCQGLDHPCPLKEAKKTKKPVMLEHVHRSPDGSSRIMEIHAHPVLDSQGNVTRIIEYCLDITEKRRSEQALRESEQRYRTLFERARDSIMLIDLDGESFGRIAEANLVAAETHGYSIEELLKLRIHDLDTPESAEKIPERAEMLLRGKWLRGEGVHRRKDGTVFPIEISGSLVELSGRKYCLSIDRDITDRERRGDEVKKSLSLFRSILDSTVDGILVVDINGRVVAWNRRFQEMWGISPELLKTKDDAILLNSATDQLKDPDAFMARVLELYSKPETESFDEVEFKDGRIFERHSRPQVADGKIFGRVWSFHDVTKQRTLLKQLLQAQKMEAIGALAGGLAHDFKNLLQVILGYSDLLLFDKKRGDSGYEELQAIKDAAWDGSDLSNRILTFSRRDEPNARAVNLGDEVIRVKKTLTRMIPKMISIETFVPADIRLVYADPGQIEQVILNLAVNAQHAMPDGGRLTIETRNVTIDERSYGTDFGMENGDYVLLMVSDTGRGMSKEVLERIFEPFYTTKGPGEGTGLGLAMVYGIVESHRGRIACYSEIGAGTTFKIHFPAILQETEPEACATMEMPAFGTETILLVDDEHAVRETAAKTLERVGYKVLEAGDGKEALEVYHRNREQIALVILDYMMPVMGGKDCLAGLLKMNPDVKVVVASGYTADREAQDFMQIGARGFIDKPYGSKDFLLAVRRALDGG